MNPIEKLRATVIDELLSLNTLQTVWPVWSVEIKKIITASQTIDKGIIDIGNNLYRIFKSTSSGRSQSAISAGGTAWEGLVCWYLNLCLLGSRTVVIKSKKANIPQCISDCISVNYQNFTSNTESDLLAITFPDDPILHVNYTGEHQSMMTLLTDLVGNNFKETELSIIQCKTNWNDNAQIPMLWDLIYSAKGFESGTQIGINGYSHEKLKKFTYSFVTVPTVDPKKINPTSTAVMRVRNLSGGNYWGLPSTSGVASNIFQMIQRNFNSSHHEYQNGWNQDIPSKVRKMIKHGNVFQL